MKSNPDKRMRVFAGPNGSGKSAVYNLIQRQFRIGYYINADEIQDKLSVKGFLNLDDYGLQLPQLRFEKYLTESPFAVKASESGLGIHLRLQENVLVSISSKSNSYEAAFIAEMLRWEYLSQGITFSFETVMSHPSKLDIFHRAKEAGYKSYLYFVCTQNPTINKERIQNRITKGGHPVPEIKIEERYHRSLEILASAAMAAHHSYFIR
ncbi:MAG: zeta toxin family protein [Saprospiraceae bacterium]|nr:zeta toxin family protein [Saprospiraceae bacterium]MCF8250015.1 zeta toxin family protein [Saprospiraceae bacterium]MCF8278945.1 zeta toxin family protein [Bacteroidales bacterium]MCF8311028.1 zeta toxin family protein [Saprospiraceae bacterium]MCF8439636.1 zeta toxin family protein [Saprospiraceae bacterium]